MSSDGSNAKAEEKQTSKMYAETKLGAIPISRRWNSLCIKAQIVHQDFLTVYPMPKSRRDKMFSESFAKNLGKLHRSETRSSLRVTHVAP